MATYTALTTLNGRDRAEALGEAMENLTPEPTGVGVLEIEDGAGVWEVGGYFTEAPDETGLALLAAAFDARTFAISKLDEVDWVAQVRRELAPVVAGRFFLYGSHDAAKVPGDVIALAIDAAMAFGTGHHGTTRGCLLALDALASTGKLARNVADIGCGTAVLAMAAAKLWPEATITGGDIDEVAVETALANIRNNGLEGRVQCEISAGFDHALLQGRAPYDLIFGNILMGPLIALAGDMANAVEEKGHVVLSGILNTQAAEVLRAYEKVGFTRIAALELGEWTTLTLAKSNA